MNPRQILDQYWQLNLHERITQQRINRGKVLILWIQYDLGLLNSTE
jgi:hypothetical protein